MNFAQTLKLSSKLPDQIQICQTLIVSPTSEVSAGHKRQPSKYIGQENFSLSWESVKGDREGELLQSKSELCSKNIFPCMRIDSIRLAQILLKMFVFSILVLAPLKYCMFIAHCSVTREIDNLLMQISEK